MISVHQRPAFAFPDLHSSAKICGESLCFSDDQSPDFPIT
jgi:hypothetical protein